MGKEEYRFTAAELLELDRINHDVDQLLRVPISKSLIGYLTLYWPPSCLLVFIPVGRNWDAIAFHSDGQVIFSSLKGIDYNPRALVRATILARQKESLLPPPDFTGSGLSKRRRAP